MPIRAIRKERDLFPFRKRDTIFFQANGKGKGELSNQSRKSFHVGEKSKTVSVAVPSSAGYIVVL